MFKNRPKSSGSFQNKLGLPHLTAYNFSLKSSKPKSLSLLGKLIVGLSCLGFLSAYQPTAGFPPVRVSLAKAQAPEQVQTINFDSLPFAFKTPHPGYLTTKFSRWHPGIDLATGLGMPIRPITAGLVTQAGYNFWGLGLTVTIDHGAGYKSTYAHLGKIYVKSGQQVKEQDILGVVGLTGNTSGPHTHLEIVKDEVRIDPLTILPQMPTLAIKKSTLTSVKTSSSTASLSSK